MDESTKITRRGLVAAGAVGALGMAALPVVARAEEMSMAKAAGGGNANVKVVNDFIAAWTDPDKAVTFLTDDAAIRMEEDKPAIIGPAATAAAFKGFMSGGTTLSVKVLSTTVKGPVVMNTRVDTLKTPGKPDQAFKVVGVFVVKKGKIKEWTDYLDV